MSEEASNRRVPTRDKLLDAAFEIIHKEGHAGLRSAKVSEVSGVSRGGQLHHFGTKDELVAAVYVEAFDRLENASWQAIEQANGNDILGDLLNDACDRFSSDAFWVILDIRVADSKRCKDLDKLVVERRGDRPLARRGWEERLVAAGVAPDRAHQITATLWNCAKGLSVRGLVNNDRAHAAKVCDLALQLARQQSGLTN